MGLTTMVLSPSIWKALWGKPEQLKISLVWAGSGLAKFSDGEKIT